MKLISDYSFSQQDQIEFAKLSGDWNPIHVDPIFARRTIYGQVVHGINIILFSSTEIFIIGYCLNATATASINIGVKVNF